MDLMSASTRSCVPCSSSVASRGATRARRAPARAWAIAAAALVGLALPAAAHAQDTTSREGVRLGLKYELGTRPAVLVLPVTGVGGDSVRAILQRDLDFGDRVTVLPAGADVARPQGGRYNYDLLAKLGAAALVEAAIAPGGVRVAVHDVGGKRVLQRRDLPLPGAVGSPEWRMAVHAASDEVERWITGTRGISATRVLFVRDGKVHMVDSDGENVRGITTSGTALSPTWHPSGRQIAFVLFNDRGTQVVVRDLATGNSRRVSEIMNGLNITPTFSPDGATLAFAHGEEEGTDIFATASQGGGARRVTIGRGSDNVSPSFSPDGRRIAFTSGRSGHPEVYISDIDGTNAELLTPFNFGDQSYRSNPDWSPDGRTIAFQSQLAGEFQIMTINLRDRGLKQLTAEGMNEDPSWAPDGRHLVFTSTRTGSKQLFVLDTETGRARQLTRGAPVRFAAWSPFLDRAR